MKQHFFYAAIMILVFAGTFSSCKKGSPDVVPTITNPTGTTGSTGSTGTTVTPGIPGTWKGAVINTVEKTSYAISFTLTQSGNNITGQFSTLAAPGTVTGSVSGNSVTLILTPAPASGYTEVDTFTGTLNINAIEITGAFTSTVGGIKGTFDITKQ